MHFLKLASNLDVLPLLLALRQQPGLWGRSFRTTFAESPHREMLDIILRCQVPDKSEDFRECFWHPAWACLPQARSLVYGLMSRLEGERLGRVMVTWAVPGSQIYPHRDVGSRAEGHYDEQQYYQRYHIVLESPPEAIFTCGEEGDQETVHMFPGDAWWFNNALLHSVQNRGQTDRIHLIVDIKNSHLGS